MGTHDYFTGWQPPTLVRAAKDRTQPDFERECDFSLCLAIITTSLPELDQALLQAAAADFAQLAFRTETLIKEHGTIRHTPAIAWAVDDERLRTENLSRLARERCHILPLIKRDERSFLSTISVGRSRNHDIVLRHASVSKFHASFEVGATDVRLRDARSRNRTFLNGVEVGAEVQVWPGDRLRFAAVEAVLATPRTLWSAIHGDSPRLAPR